MEEIEIIEAEEELRLPQPPSLTVAIAINGSRKSKYIVKWALEKFVPEGKSLFKLIHVCDPIIAVPTPMGNFIPMSQVRDDVADAYKSEVIWQKNEILLPYTKMCSQRKVLGDVKVLESDDVPNAIAKEIAKNTITELVIGVSSPGIFTRKGKRQNLSARISECAPSFCTVYAISKKHLSSVRPPNSESGSIGDDSSGKSSSTNNSSRYSTSSQSDRSSSASYSHFHPPTLPMQRFQALSALNHTLLNKGQHSLSRGQSQHIGNGNDYKSRCRGNSNTLHSIHQVSSHEGLPTDNESLIYDQASTSDDPTDSYSEPPVNPNLELERLRIELRHVRGLYAVAQSETIDASRKLKDVNQRHLEEAIKLRELNIMEVKARESVMQEKERYEAAKREAESMKDRAEREALQRKEAEKKALYEALEREKLENALRGSTQLYKKFTWEEIVSATSSFSENLRIGMGAFGVVYKGIFHHTTVAVKVFHSNEAQEGNQFQQELEILSRIRHPHLLLLIGACPEHSCVVYEHMENGSLDDSLLRKNDARPIPWFERFRIAREVASALVYLHTLKPEPIVHRDLKPANILLDHNLVSKIGDVGLSAILQLNQSSLSLISKDAGIVGTYCYIDPEYHRSGINSVKSDVYAFGIVVLQLVTAKPAMALADVVETAVDEDRLMEILDLAAGEWPLEETKELVQIGLSCSEVRRKDRPDLKDQVLPALERLEKSANKGRILASSFQPPPPHFICPILQEVMNDPCVAADGYTYDRKAIELWLEENGKSPMTNMPLQNKNLIPNYTLLSAIMDWKFRKQ